ncbi:monofunctional biosynthetic peptidoglycan transglycosylase [Emticicia sp. BO119]|uniref:monofunctional biosynthetic peptidoglycan transglycosylase n=1 Tax=Emticicia sp. BO119 TaxID=2757768 RepID=UPI0015F0D95D|nr:monofunctional biosynthetic peptidoglycan transglycosylase [Emticicia sp. BO119]MBA4852220.1 monofunctional biosynthetic peptidoglycan transglycosylase [Emticicia sp. BO119]
MAKNTFRSKTPPPAKASAASSKSRLSSVWVRLKRTLFRFIIFFFTSTISAVILFKFVPVPFTATMLSRKIEAIADGKDSEIYYEWKSYDKISKEAPLAIVAAEDQLFPEHYGFDFKSMGNAFQRNMKGKKIRGASTISQQVAKNVFLWQTRSYIRKAIEVYFTALIELIWGKQRILEVYLNVAEMGSMTFGVEEASKRYFGKSAKDLTRDQAARIAAVLPSPIKWSIAKPGPYVVRRTGQIARQMRALGGPAYLSGLRKF